MVSDYSEVKFLNNNNDNLKSHYLENYRLFIVSMEDGLEGIMVGSRNPSEEAISVPEKRW